MVSDLYVVIVKRGNLIVRKNTRKYLYLYDNPVT